MNEMVEGKVNLSVKPKPKPLHSDALLEPISLRLLVNNASDGGVGTYQKK